MAHRVLDVRLGGDLVGKLEQDAWGSVRFAYEGGWLNSPEARSLSASLPLRPGRFTPKETRPFFAGLLPEEESRRLVAGVFGISARNDFALLERIGGECAGAVSLWPEGGSQDIPQPTYRELSEEGLKTLLEDVEHRPLLAGELGARLSLAGAQKKLVEVIGQNFFGKWTWESLLRSSVWSPRRNGLFQRRRTWMRRVVRVPRACCPC